MLTITEALAVIAVHGHPHYKSEEERRLLNEAREVVREYVNIRLNRVAKTNS